MSIPIPSDPASAAKTVGSKVAGSTADVLVAGAKGAASVIPSVSSLSSLIPTITGDLRHFVLRIVEGVLGIILIAVGVASLTKAVPIATKVAGVLA